MDHGIHLSFAHEPDKPIGIGDIHHAQTIGSHVVTVAAREIVYYSDVVPALEQYSRGMRSDVAGAAGNEDVFV